MNISPSPSGSRTGDRAARRRSAIGRVWIAGVLLLLELGLAALSLEAIGWSAQAQPPFLVTGVSAIVGVAVLAVIAAANASAARAEAAGAPPASGLASLGMWLAVTRLVALLGAAALVVVARGGPDADLADAGLFCFAAVAALLAVLLAGLTTRALRGGSP